MRSFGNVDDTDALTVTTGCGGTVLALVCAHAGDTNAAAIHDTAMERRNDIDVMNDS
jgi:hypothetical protein